MMARWKNPVSALKKGIQKDQTNQTNLLDCQKTLCYVLLYACISLGMHVHNDRCIPALSDHSF